MFNAVPTPWMGGRVTDYGLKVLKNGGLASVHLPSGRQVPHVLAAPAHRMAGAPSGVGSLLSKVALPLQAVSAVTGVLNLGVGIYNGYQLHQLRKETSEIKSALAAASDERRALHAETIQALGLVYEQGTQLLREQQVVLASTLEQFAIDRVDRVAERMIALELVRRDLALSADPRHARVLEDKANEAVSTVMPLLQHRHPQARLPLVAYAVQAYTAKVDANLALEALEPHGPSRNLVAQQAQRDALELIRAEQTRALGSTFAENYNDDTELWLPDAYFAMYQAVAGTGIVETGDAQEVRGLVVPTRTPIPALAGASDRAHPNPSARIWTPADGPERLWDLRPGLAAGPQPADGRWGEAVPTVQEAAAQLGTEVELTDLSLVLAAVEIRSSTSEVLLDDAVVAHEAAALAPLASSDRVLIDGEVLWAFAASLMEPADLEGPESQQRHYSPLDLVRERRVASADATLPLRRATADADAYMPWDGELRKALHLLYLLNLALTQQGLPAGLVQHPCADPSDLAWSFLALEVATLSGEVPNQQDAASLMRALEAVASDIPGTVEAMANLLRRANDAGVDLWSQTDGVDLVSQVSARTAAAAALLAQDPHLHGYAMQAGAKLPGTWVAIFQPAEKVLEAIGSLLPEPDLDRLRDLLTDVRR